MLCEKYILLSDDETHIVFNTCEKCFIDGGKRDVLGCRFGVEKSLADSRQAIFAVENITKKVNLCKCD